MGKKNVVLPPLPFSGQRAVEFRDAARLSEDLSRTGSATIEYWPVEKDGAFQGRASTMRTGETRLTAVASSPVYSSASDAKRGIVLIPFHGNTVSHSDNRQVEWGQGQCAAYLPPAPSRGQGGLRAALGIDATPRHLEAIARTMVADDVVGASERILDFGTPRALNMNVGGVHFDQLFRHYMAMLDAMGGDGLRMERTGLEDMMLRAVVMLLAPKLFFAEGKRRKTKLNEVCDYIDANLDKKITLTELERLSGHSARSLQYAFRSAFDRTPMQWVLDQRLEAVRRRILAAKAGVTLTALAADYFGNLGEFSRLYKARYGELPSQTLQRSQARPLKT